MKTAINQIFPATVRIPMHYIRLLQSRSQLAFNKGVKHDTVCTSY